MTLLISSYLITVCCCLWLIFLDSKLRAQFDRNLVLLFLFAALIPIVNVVVALTIVDYDFIKGGKVK